MGGLKLNIVSGALLNDYLKQVPPGTAASFSALKDAETSTGNFSFYTSVSAIASSRIEGERMEVDSYVKHKMLNTAVQPDLVEKPNDLYKAYIYAQQNALSKQNFEQAHAILTAHLLPEPRQGKCRTGNMVVLEHRTGRIQYEAAPVQQVERLYGQLWEDIEQLKASELPDEAVFYYASYIHLVLVNIHPFEDGNGRAGRLLEKWFIAQMLGPRAWFLQSELYYYEHINEYYLNLNKLGMFYEKLDYSRSLPFLLMLPKALSGNKG